MVKGFTLVELMIVVAIIAILAAVGLISIGENIRKANDSNVLQTLGAFRGAVGESINPEMDNGFMYAEKISDLKKYLSPSIEKIIRRSDDTVTAFEDDSDVLSSYQMKAGTVRNNSGASSNGTALYLNGVPNVVEIFYNNREGILFVDGVGEDVLNTKVYKNTKKKYWKDY